MSYEALKAAITLGSDLEQDLRAHVDFYFEVVRGYAQAQGEVASLKFGLEQTEAELLERVRTVAAKAGDKLTVDAAAAKVRGTDEFIEAKRALLQAERDQGEWQALKLAYESRGHCLRDLTLLATRGGSPTGISDYSTMRQSAADSRRARPPLTKR